MRERTPFVQAAGGTRARRHSAIVASIPGRMRLRAALIRQSRYCDTLIARLQSIDCITAMEANPIAGSVLLRYNVGHCSQAAMEARVTEAVAATLEMVPGAPLPASPAGQKAAREWNRVAKLGMLVSLPVSLALAAAGSKRLHALSGGAFTLLLLVHMAMHRRHLLK